MSRSLSASSGRDKKHFSLHGTSSLGAASIHWARRKVSATWRRNVNSGQALLLQVKCKTGGRQQVKREPRAGCDNIRPAGSHQPLSPATTESTLRFPPATAELHFSLSLHGSSLRSSCRPHRAAGVWTRSYPAPDYPHWGHPAGTGVHGRVGSVGYFWTSVCRGVKSSRWCNESSAVQWPQ